MFNYMSEEDKAVCRQAVETIASYNVTGMEFTSTTRTKEWFKLRLRGLEEESFYVLYLDTQHRILSLQEEFKGTIDSCTIHPRVIAKRALTCNAGAVILAHNHPSGNAEPSASDKKITNKVVEALGLFDIRVLDHMVVGNEVTSFAEIGLL